MDHSAVIFRFISDLERWQGMAFREVLVTQVKEVLRAWLAGLGKRPAARRAGVDGKTAARYIAAARAAGRARGGGEARLGEELRGRVGAGGRAAGPAGPGPAGEGRGAGEAQVAG